MRIKQPFIHVFSFFFILTAFLLVSQKSLTAEAAGADRLYYFNMDSNGIQGNLILVESNGSWGLLDTGHRYADTIQDADGRIISTPQSTGLSSQISMRSGRDVANYMINQLGVTHLDFIVGTHAHSDHIGGVPEIATTSFRDASGKICYLVDSNTTYYYKEYQHIANFEDDIASFSNTSWHNQAYAYQATKTMRDQGANMVDVSTQQVIHGDPENIYGDYITFTMGDMTFRLYNVYEQTNTGNENVNSIVTVMTNEKYTVVNLSDINTNNGAIDKTSEAISKDYGTVDVVVAGHHGYAGSNTKTMFDELQPDYVVISNGSDQNSWLYTNGDLAAAIPYAQGLFGTSFFSTALSPYAIVTDLSGNQVYVYSLESNGSLTDAFYKAIKSSKKTGWVSWVNTDETLWSYLENGKALKDTWQRINGRMYHFDQTGIMNTGWFTAEGKVQYLDENGGLVVGWKMIGDKWYYFESDYGNRIANAWQKIDGKMYFFNQDGVMQTGWVADDKGIHYCNGSGALITGRQQIDGKWYYFEKNYGLRVTDGWQKIDGKMYYFDGDGQMLSGWVTDEKGTHYCDDSGALVIGWRQIDGKWYYFEKNYGLRVTDGWQKINGKMYHFDQNGVMQTGWITDEKGTHYCDNSGALATGWQQVDGKWHYFDTQYGCLVSINSWQKINGKMYYFDADGDMQIGWVTDEKGTHYCDDSGALVTGQRQIDGNWYYFEKNYGLRVTDGWQKIDGKMYYFDGDGQMQTGWVTDEKGTHYCDDSGALVTGWRQIDGRWYYFETGYGYRVNNTWQKIDGKMYYFDDSGVMQTGWLSVDGRTQYVDENGNLLTGWQWIGDKCYFFSYENGDMARDTVVDGYYVDADGVWIP